MEFNLNHTIFASLFLNLIGLNSLLKHIFLAESVNFLYYLHYSKMIQVMFQPPYEL